VSLPRTFVLTGASGSFGSALKASLEREGSHVDTLRYQRDWTYDDYSGADDKLRAADVLVLAHGSRLDQAMAANCDSFIAFIERFRRLKAGYPRKPEIWAVGSEIELHPSWGNKDLQTYSRSKRAFARYAAGLFRDPGLTYRHIVPSAFTSRMGPGLMSGETAAKVALFLIRRGWRYVPVTYTGVALANYFRFRSLAS
jgi:monoglucosyldiacylglycerol epimerase